MKLIVKARLHRKVVLLVVPCILAVDLVVWPGLAQKASELPALDSPAQSASPGRTPGDQPSRLKNFAAVSGPGPQSNQASGLPAASSRAATNAGLDSPALLFRNGSEAEPTRLTFDATTGDREEMETGLVSLSRSGSGEASSADSAMLAEFASASGNMADLQDVLLFYEPNPFIFLIPAFLICLDLFWGLFNRSSRLPDAPDAFWGLRGKF
jgi:hypothetical protein